MIQGILPVFLKIIEIVRKLLSNTYVNYIVWNRNEQIIGGGFMINFLSLLVDQNNSPFTSGSNSDSFGNIKLAKTDYKNNN